MTGKVSHYWKVTASISLPFLRISQFASISQNFSVFSETCDTLLTLSHHLQVALDKSLEGRHVYFDFPAAFDRDNHRDVLYKLRYIVVEEKFLPLVLEFLSDRR